MRCVETFRGEFTYPFSAASSFASRQVRSQSSIHYLVESKIVIFYNNVSKFSFTGSLLAQVPVVIAALINLQNCEIVRDSTGRRRAVRSRDAAQRAARAEWNSQINAQIPTNYIDNWYKSLVWNRRRHWTLTFEADATVAATTATITSESRIKNKSKKSIFSKCNGQSNLSNMYVIE